MEPMGNSYVKFGSGFIGVSMEIEKELHRFEESFGKLRVFVCGFHFRR